MGEDMLPDAKSDTTKPGETPIQDDSKASATTLLHDLPPVSTSKKDDILHVDFFLLAVRDEDFEKMYERNKKTVNFKNSDDVQLLTKTILKVFFKLNVDLPSDRLCPPVPIRYEYIRWLQSLVDTTDEEYQDAYDPARVVIGVDIGTGATSIYPLIGCSLRPDWHFIATELDDKNYTYAEENIAANDLKERIHQHRATTDGPLIPPELLETFQADFVMCNPPFFASKVDMNSTYLNKSEHPSAVCTGADIEMICEGGDLGFASRILEESLKLMSSVQWYTCMLGKLSSATALVAKVKAAGISNWAVKSLQSGHKTKRWVVAWSFVNLRPRNNVARGDAIAKELLPFPTEYTIGDLVAFEGELKTRIDKIFSPLSLKWSWETSDTTPSEPSGLCFAKANVWSRAARRKQRRPSISIETAALSVLPVEVDKGGFEDEEAVLGVRITVAANEGLVTLRWLRGQDSVLFESFCGMLKRELSRDFQKVKASAAEISEKNEGGVDNA